MHTSFLARAAYEIRTRDLFRALRSGFSSHGIGLARLPHEEAVSTDQMLPAQPQAASRCQRGGTGFCMPIRRSYGHCDGRVALLARQRSQSPSHT